MNQNCHLKVIFALATLSLSLSACAVQKSSGNTSINKEFLHGTGEPTNDIGEEYSHYYNETTKYVYEKRDGQWINQYTIGSDALYSKTKAPQNGLIKRANKIDSDEDIAPALANTFYSTNITIRFEPHWPEGEGWNFISQISKRDIHAYSEQEDIDLYLKMQEDGIATMYDESTSTYLEVDNDNIYCMVPHPTYDNITYCNYLLYDDELGQQTSIIIGHLDEATYDESTGFYEIDNIVAKHSPMTSKYFLEPLEDTIVFNFKFKLSEDKQFIEHSFLTYVSFENAKGAEGLCIEFIVTNYHSTVIQMP